MKSVFLAILSSVSFGAAAANYCNIKGDISGIICVSETGYVLESNDQQIYSCPHGTWCANRIEICVSDGVPACRFLKECGNCFSISRSICVTASQYVACIDGLLDTSWKTCPDSMPYCSMQYDGDDILHAVCTDRFQNTCDYYPTTTSTRQPEPTNPEFECAGFGKFPVKSDPACKSYHYCYADQNINGDDIISSVIYTCPGDTVYDPLKSKCVVSTNFECIYV